MNYTAQDFEKALASSGLSGQFSRWDLDTAQKNPDFGMGILSAKQNYNAAATPEQKILANEEANDLRRRYGYYSGGSNGAQYLPTGQMTPQIYGKIEEIGSFPDYQEPYKDMYNSALDRLGSMGSFSYDKAAPTYTNAYADLQKKLLDSVVNRDPFTWSKETDPQWGSYKKSYLREGERATANALAQASAASGGRPSSYAVNAATQAGDYYAAKLNDMIPTLYQQAYDRYLQEFQMDRQKLGDVNTQEQIDYNRYLTDLGQYNTDRDFALNVYNSDFDRNNAYLNAIMELDNMAYGRYSDSYDRLLSQLGVQPVQRQPGPGPPAPGHQPAAAGTGKELLPAAAGRHPRRGRNPQRRSPGLLRLLRRVRQRPRPGLSAPADGAGPGVCSEAAGRHPESRGNPKPGPHQRQRLLQRVCAGPGKPL